MRLFIDTLKHGLLKSHRGFAKAGEGIAPDVWLHVKPGPGLGWMRMSGSSSMHETSVSLLFIFIPNPQYQGIYVNMGVATSSNLTVGRNSES